MAKKRGIRVRISHQRVAALQEICEEMMEDFSPQNDHQQLLGEYLHELHDKLKEMATRNQEMYTLMLVGSEATAFYQLWKMLDISRDKYAVLIVDNLLEKMSALAA
jgi:arginyl-tRNA--protein-N-Asp/Glu arginylyltransferase